MPGSAVSSLAPFQGAPGLRIAPLFGVRCTGVGAKRRVPGCNAARVSRKTVAVFTLVDASYTNIFILNE